MASDNFPVLDDTSTTQILHKQIAALIQRHIVSLDEQDVTWLLTNLATAERIYQLRRLTGYSSNEPLDARILTFVQKALTGTRAGHPLELPFILIVRLYELLAEAVLSDDGEAWNFYRVALPSPQAVQRAHDMAERLDALLQQPTLSPTPDTDLMSTSVPLIEDQGRAFMIHNRTRVLARKLAYDRVLLPAQNQ